MHGPDAGRDSPTASVLPPPLVLTVPLWDDESLPSFLTRLSERNAYHPPTILTRMCWGNHPLPPPKQRSCPSSPTVFMRLAALTGLSMEQLYRATPHRFAHVLSASAQKRATITLSWPSEMSATFTQTDLPCLTDSLMRTELRPEDAAQYCPLCLAEAAYHRLQWWVTAIAICPQHHCLLAHGCPNCQQPVSIAAICRTECAQCGTDLRTASTGSVAEEPHVLRSQAALQAWLDARPYASDAAAVQLPNQPPGVLYDLLNDLCAALIKHSRVLDGVTVRYRLGERPRLMWEGVLRKRFLAPRGIATMFAAAFDGIANWPHSACTLQRTYPLLECAALGLTWDAVEVQLYRAWVRDRRPFAATAPWIQAALEQTYRAQQRTVDLSVAAQFLQCSHAMIERCVVLRAAAQGNGPLARSRHAAHLPLTTIVALGKRWQRPVSVHAAAQWLGVRPDTVRALVATKRLRAEPVPPSDPQQVVFQLATLDRWLDEFARRLVTLEHGDVVPGDRVRSRWIPCTTALACGLPAGLTEATLLALLHTGQMQGYRLPDALLSLDGIVIDRAQLAAYEEVAAAGDAWVSSDEAQRVLRVHRRVLYIWMHAGLLVPVRPPERGRIYFERQAFNHFRTHYCRHDEIRAQFHVAPSCITQWMRSGLLHPVDVGINTLPRLFRRAEVEAAYTTWQARRAQRQQAHVRNDDRRPQRAWPMGALRDYLPLPHF